MHATHLLTHALWALPVQTEYQVLSVTPSTSWGHLTTLRQGGLRFCYSHVYLLLLLGRGFILGCDLYNSNLTMSAHCNFKPNRCYRSGTWLHPGFVNRTLTIPLNPRPCTVRPARCTPAPLPPHPPAGCTPAPLPPHPTRRLHPRTPAPPPPRRLHPRTGRKHQLRRHCAQQLGLGILGGCRVEGLAASNP